ncbi:MAG TPA: DNA polymerase III subunit alpha, partial [Flavihumibacter sp.]|nr:DNA polymerase III subunit alpha [Flavihumibacter sp.]
GLKGVGEAAVDSIIKERNNDGAYKTIFDLMKRVNQRTVNKKTLECLACAGAFDCFTELHRAQYFYLPPGDNTTRLEKVIKYGNVYQAQSQGTTNTLFGDLPAVLDIPTPKIPACEPWSLTDRLEKEKEVTGIFLSGHPLDHFRFEMTYYGIMTLAEFNEIKENPAAVAGRPFRLAGLVVDGQHRITRTGRNFGVLSLEDYTGKTEFMLWGEDYMRFKDYLDKGKNLFVSGSFKSRFNSEQYEFKPDRINLLESIKSSMSKQMTLSVEPRLVTNELVDFLAKNMKQFPGKTNIRINLGKTSSLYSIDTGIEMNDELTAWLAGRPELEVKIDTV